MLGYLKRTRSQKIQLRRLQSFPIGLTEVYERLLSEVARSLDQEELVLRRQIFLLLVEASRPFTLDELAVFSALRCPDGFLDKTGLLLDPKGKVLRLCWPLAMVIDNSVQLSHMSVKEFLIKVPEEMSAAGKAASGLISPRLTLRVFQCVVSTHVSQQIQPAKIQISQLYSAAATEYYIFSDLL